jgi:hypothetical protein
VPESEPEKPFYEFVGREPHPPFTDHLIWRNRANHDEKIVASEWWFWRLWRFSPYWLRRRTEEVS